MTASRLLIAILFLSSARMAFACSCSNSIPIQKTYERYRDRAVFTAHVTQLMGRGYNFEGKRTSGQVLAVVKERYWGLPWYWPKVVVLDGGFFCNIVMEEGQDYLVSGVRARYGVLEVSGCSRTQELETAQVDLRTLDGSHCSGPGGTIIGHVYRGQESYRRNPPAPGINMTFTDQDGNAHPALTDSNGIYELEHLQAGSYTLDSHFNSTQYFAGGKFTIQGGVCYEVDVLLRDYDLYGRLLPGLGYHAPVKLVGADSSVWERGDVQSDGMFYFKDVPDGEYLLAVESLLQGQGSDFYYPGTFDRRKATRIRIVNHNVRGSNQFTFDPGRLPYVPISVVLDKPTSPERFYWRILLVTPNNIIEEERWPPGTRSIVLYGLRGQSYGIRLYGDPNYKTSNEMCSSADFPVTATPGLKTIHVQVPPNCQ